MHEFISYVADRTASREVDALFDYYSLGRLIVSGEVSYDTARDDLAAAFTARDMSAGTAKVYVSQGYSLAQLFDSFDDLEDFADDECKGSRSLKRIYDAVKQGGDAKAKKALIDVVLAGLANLSDASEIARVRDAAIAMLAPAAVAA